MTSASTELLVLAFFAIVAGSALGALLVNLATTLDAWWMRRRQRRRRRRARRTLHRSLRVGRVSR